MILPPAMPLFLPAKDFDQSNPYINDYVATVTMNQIEDAALLYEYALDFLSEVIDHENNFKSYRSELTTFIHWCWSVEQQPLERINRPAMRRFLEWCQNPPAELTAEYNSPQFVFDKNTGGLAPNYKWRPFTKRKNKTSSQNIEDVTYSISNAAIKTKLSILSMFFQFLNVVEYCDANPAAIMLKLKKYKQPQACLMGEDDDELKFFSELQWSYVIDTVEQLAIDDPASHERTLFLIKLLYATYVRISEISARPSFSPVMSQFRRNKATGDLGFYIPISKGGKRRTVAVSDELKAALVRYRLFLKLPELPAPGETTPLFVRHKAASHGRSAGEKNANLGIRQLREQVQLVFTATADKLDKDGFKQDAAEVRILSVHSIRHTGISADLANGRPLQHVQSCAGHESIEVTSRYVHTTRAERHQSAKSKKLNPLD